MPTVDERVAALEAKVDAITDLRGDMNRRFAEVDGRFAQIDQRFNQIDSRFTQIDGRFTLIEGRFTLVEGRFLHLEGELNRRFASLDAKVDRNFVWTMGTMMTGFIAVIAALIGVAYR